MKDDIRKENQKKIRKTVDPDPIITIGLIISVTTVAVNLTSLLVIATKSAFKTKRRKRRIRSVLYQAMKVANSLQEDIYEFRRIYKPKIVREGDETYSMWDLGEYDNRTMRLILNRMLRNYDQLQRIQNKIGELQLGAIGDSWRMHSINKSTELFKVLGSVRTLQDLEKLNNEMFKSINEYSKVVVKMLSLYIEK